MKSPPSSGHGVSHEKGAALGLVAAVLGLLALLCIAGLGAKSCLDGRSERKRREVKEKVAAAAGATEAARRNASSFVTALPQLDDDPPGERSYRRLTSLSAGPFVFEKH